jgi:hypothetical protein
MSRHPTRTRRLDRRSARAAEDEGTSGRNSAVREEQSMSDTAGSSSILFRRKRAMCAVRILTPGRLPTPRTVPISRGGFERREVVLAKTTSSFPAPGRRRHRTRPEPHLGVVSLVRVPPVDEKRDAVSHSNTRWFSIVSGESLSPASARRTARN